MYHKDFLFAIPFLVKNAKNNVSVNALNCDQYLSLLLVHSRLTLQLLTFFPGSQSFPFLAPFSHTVLAQQLIGIADTALEFPKTDFPRYLFYMDLTPAAPLQRIAISTPPSW